MTAEGQFSFKEALLVESRLQARTNGFQAQLLDQFYGEIFNDWELQGQTLETLDAWTGGNDQAMGEVEEGWDGGGGAGAHSWCAGELYDTRDVRWDLFASKIGIDVPEYFHLYTGSPRPDFFRYVTQEWFYGDSELPLLYPGSRVSSWSFDLKVAEAFASRTGDQGVVFEAVIPFALTLADLWVDDGALVTTYRNEKEVLVCTPMPNSAGTLRKSSRLMVDGTWYGYHEKDRLFDTLNKRSTRV